ncbi:hypothetical protein AB0B92_20295 [Streptomyces hygroscopicus]|uniref:hypothetical protein n=1 Tax=Streptomyces hygroscopicus TaxID=1912 RepID=UPI0034031C94
MPQDVTVAGATEVATADLDGDGCADVITTAGEALGKREPSAPRPPSGPSPTSPGAAQAAPARPAPLPASS